MKYIKLVYILTIFFLLAAVVSGQVKLPKLIGDGMVLQRDAYVKIWGWAPENEKITVQFIDSVYTAAADNSGKWNIILPKLKPGGPYTMQIKSRNEIFIRNIMIGDVWLCSGQSNMELSMERVRPLYEKEIANSDNENIRYFAVPQKYNFKQPLEDLESGEWKTASPENVPAFSAAAYFFAKELYNKYRIPIGLINASLGGSPAQAWISEETLKKFPDYYNEALKFRDNDLIKQIESEDNSRIQAWYKALNEKDEGYKDHGNTWRNPELNTSDWSVMNVPGYWSDSEPGIGNGVVWFRKIINIPYAPANKAKLNLGRIVDADSVFINDSFIGTTSYQYPPRRYIIPGGVLKKGRNTIVVRVINSSGKGGFVPDKPYEIILDKDTIDLTGQWHYRCGAVMEPLASQTFIRWKPLGLYNAMISPLINYRIKGAIWYQGEANTFKPYEYRELLPKLINDWRKNGSQGDFPFLFVQLPNYMESKTLPTESNWAVLRESQLKTLCVPNTAMAVTIDIGEWNDIHPLNKKDVGYRLALAAQKAAYDEKDIVFSGPMYHSMSIDGSRIILTFTNTGSGLIAKGSDSLKYFSICGKDKIFVWAKAKIENDKIIVWNDNVPEPAAVRYAWADNPEGANLYNKEGLPASPFRTDDFR